MSPPPAPTALPLRLLLRLRVWLAEVVRPSELQANLFWAGVIGFLGACASFAFRRLTEWLHLLLTRQSGGYVESFTHLPPWARVVIPAGGGLLAGVTLFFGMRWTHRRSSTDYMEAIVLGTGMVSVRASLLKSCSALWSISSGASIGREGPLVQLSAMLASLLGRLLRKPTLTLRLMVACGAAAGIASAYNAPFGGALFVGEIILQSVAMETFGPLVFASVIATLTVRQLLGEQPLYEVPPARLQSNWEILPFLVLGLGAGLLAPWFLRLLRTSERLFSRLGAPPYVRLTLGGLIVGVLAVLRPEVCGNGHSVVNDILQGHYVWEALLLILALKLIATAATFGSGAVGGVFTPTLFVGACLGYLLGQGVELIFPGSADLPRTFAAVGMGCLLAATTHAPLMAIVMLFELTLDYQMVLPLMLACVVAHYTCLAFEPASIYAESLRRKGGDRFHQRLSRLRVVDVMKPNPPTVRPAATFRSIAEFFLTHRHSYLYVTDQGGALLGAVALHDIKSYLANSELAALVVAGDLLRKDFPTVSPEDSVSEALERFTRHDAERLPVTLGHSHGQLVGSISRTDLLLALAEKGHPGATRPEPDVAPANSPP